MSDRSASTGISETRKKDKVGSLDSLAQSVQDGKSWNQNRAYFLRTGDYTNNEIFTGNNSFYTYFMMGFWRLETETIHFRWLKFNFIEIRISHQTTISIAIR